MSIPIPSPGVLLSAWAATAAAALLLDLSVFAEPAKRKVVRLVRGHRHVDPDSKAVYPNDINSAIAQGLKPLEAQGWEIIKASLNDPDQGISDALIKSTDVLIWWGHKKHHEVSNELVDKIEKSG